MNLFPGFSPVRVNIDGGLVNGVVGGRGPPVLLLHGYPQTHAAWHRIAPVLAADYTVIATDLLGYGESESPPGAQLARFAKAAVALQQVGLMRHLGFSRFAVVGHDRGARVGYRMALDHPDVVSAYASLTVIPTIEVWDKADKDFGLIAYHWFMLAQPWDLPERLIGSDPDHFLDVTLTRAIGSLQAIHPDALASYRRAFRRETVRHAICQDYRAGAIIDAEMDRADRDIGRVLTCPVLALWPEPRRPGRGETPLEVWSRWADDARGRSVASGHLMPEEAPDAVLKELTPFLKRHSPVYG